MSSFDRQRGAIWIAVATGVVAMVAGCSSSASGSGTSPSPTAVTSAAIATTAPATSAPASATPATAAPIGTSAAPPTSTAPTTVAASPATVDPNAMLQQALGALTDAYHFTSTASVNGAVALVAEGDRIGDGSRFTVTANGAAVGYVITADATWVQQPGAAWEQIDDPPATADPIAALRAPSGVTLVSSDATTAQLAITVPGTSLGLAGDSGVTVQATIVDGALGSVAYSTTVGSSPATVTSTFAPATDPSPVIAPA